MLKITNLACFGQYPCLFFIALCVVQSILSEDSPGCPVLWQADGQAALCLLPAGRLQRSAHEREVGARVNFLTS